MVKGSDPRRQALRAARHDAGMELGYAARMMRLKVHDLLDLELGRKTFAHPDDWGRAIRAVEAWGTIQAA
jgi:hypothetical protein